jgi:hypothetical protein
MAAPPPPHKDISHQPHIINIKVNLKFSHLPYLFSISLLPLLITHSNPWWWRVRRGGSEKLAIFMEMKGRGRMSERERERMDGWMERKGAFALLIFVITIRHSIQFQSINALCVNVCA